MADKKEELQEKVNKAEPYEGYWEESYGFVFDRLEKIISSADFSRALEFGCGRGEFFERYARNFEEVVAIERDWDKRNKAMEEAYWNDVKHIQFKSSEEDGESLEDSFDMIFTGDPVRHMIPQELSDKLEKSRKLLRDDGIVVMIAPRMKRGQAKFLEVEKDEETSYTFEELGEEKFGERKESEDSGMMIRKFEKEDFNFDGLELEKIFYFHDTILPGFVDHFASRDRISNLPFFRRFFGSEMMVVLRKN